MPRKGPGFQSHVANEVATPFLPIKPELSCKTALGVLRISAIGDSKAKNALAGNSAANAARPAGTALACANSAAQPVEV